MEFWMRLPKTRRRTSAVPAAPQGFASPVTLPAAFFTAPLACSAAPLFRSLSISHLSLLGTETALGIKTPTGVISRGPKREEARVIEPSMGQLDPRSQVLSV